MPVAKSKNDPFTTRSGWTPARRLAQARRLRASRPWLCSTGPKTTEGKTKSSHNAVKHGARSAALRLLGRALRAQSLFVKIFRANTRAQAKWWRSGYLPECKPYDVSAILHGLNHSFCDDISDGLEGLRRLKLE